MSDPQPNKFPPLTAAGRFICDRCGVPISSIRTAWGQWYAAKATDPSRALRNWGFSIVHGQVHAWECSLETRDGPTVGDCQLDYLLSADGLVYLLEFFLQREVDPEELCRYIMRLFVPGYEQVYRHIPAAMAKGIIEPRPHASFIFQEEQVRIMEEHVAKEPAGDSAALTKLIGTLFLGGKRRDSGPG